MSSVAEARIRPDELSFRVLQADPRRLGPDEAARAVRLFLERKRSGLAQALRISAGPHEVVLRAEGEMPQQIIDEARDLLGISQPLAAEDEVEVDPAEFAIDVLPQAEAEPEFEREVLRSRVRCFPYPECEWFEISTGALTLSNVHVLYEPEWLIVSEQGQNTRGENTVIPLHKVVRCYRGEWWDVPCLMIETPEVTYRYGWPAERGELDMLFEVDEWLEAMRRLLEEPE